MRNTNNSYHKCLLHKEFCCVLFIIFVDIVSKEEIKKRIRDVIFVDDGNGKLVKYARVKPVEKPKRKTKVAPPQSAPRGNLSKNHECKVVSSVQKVKSTPPLPPAAAAAVSAAPPSLKSYEIEMEKCRKAAWFWFR